MVELYSFQENAFKVTGEKDDLIYLAKALREIGVEGTLSDLVYQIEWEFDIDGVRSDNDGYFDEDEYVPSSANGDYGPSNPWDAPGMSIHDFI